jgi:cell wall-associated NlpC family hydrolase
MVNAKLSLSLVICLLLVACSSAPSRTIDSVAIPLNPNATDLNNSPAVLQSLSAQYNIWQQTPYQWGGLTRKGVDCSGFVYITYREALGHNIPRSTEYQAQLGQSIARNKLRSGDLVFFQTGKKSSHVGIYLSDSNFLHASTSQGVTVSSLDNVYWNKAYRNAKRLQ